jgi:hypothetical protein
MILLEREILQRNREIPPFGLGDEVLLQIVVLCVVVAYEYSPDRLHSLTRST